MKSLSNFQPVVDALAKIASESVVTNDNGTSGRELLCHYWDFEPVYDEKRAEIETEVAKCILLGKVEEANKLREELAGLTKPKMTMVFKLMEPIRRLEGTKIVYQDKKSFRPTLENVEYLYISQDCIDMDLLDYTETDDKMVDRMGNEATIINLKLKAGMIDVKEPKLDRLGKEVRKGRANVTAISYRSMQIAGKIMYAGEQAKRKVYGMEEVM